MLVCMCFCACVHVCVHAWVCTYACMQVGMHACMWACMHGCMCMYMHGRACVPMPTYIHVCVQACACARTGRGPAAFLAAGRAAAGRTLVPGQLPRHVGSGPSSAPTLHPPRVAARMSSQPSPPPDTVPVGQRHWKGRQTKPEDGTHLPVHFFPEPRAAYAGAVLSAGLFCCRLPARLPSFQGHVVTPWMLFCSSPCPDGHWLLQPCQSPAA